MVTLGRTRGQKWWERRLLVTVYYTKYGKMVTARMTGDNNTHTRIHTQIHAFTKMYARTYTHMACMHAREGTSKAIQEI